MLSRNLARETIFFALVGVAASVCHFLVATVLIEAFSVAVWLGNIVAFLCAFPISLAGHSTLTFRAKQYGRSKAITQKATQRYLLTTGIGAALNQAGVVVLVDHLDVPHRLAIGGMIIAVSGIMFVLSKLWAFRGDHPTAM